MRKKAGFTLIELIMVIVIIGILAAIAIPKFVDLSSQAKQSATRGALGAIRSAVAIAYAENATAGNAQFPSAITTDLFSNAQIPTNQLNGNSGTVATSAVPDGTATHSTAGWWYISASGRVGAFSDGTVDTSSW